LVGRELGVKGLSNDRSGQTRGATVRIFFISYRTAEIVLEGNRRTILRQL